MDNIFFSLVTYFMIHIQRPYIAVVLSYKIKKEPRVTLERNRQRSGDSTATVWKDRTCAVRHRWHKRH